MDKQKVVYQYHETLFNHKKQQSTALAHVAQCIDHGPLSQRVAGLIPSQGTCLGFGPGPQ